MAAANKELTGRKERIRASLTARFSPDVLDVIDESAKHHGHAGARPEGETHFRVRITAAAFAGMTRVARHRAVTDALADEFAGGLHALSIDAQAP
ncbi:MAG: BolA family transcriptional regulator [Hyphomonadaceae bacterium]|nr:BolA family transcriptional regulator [Hyphomonadaceae bacterium]